MTELPSKKCLARLARFLHGKCSFSCKSCKSNLQKTCKSLSRLARSCTIFLLGHTVLYDFIFHLGRGSKFWKKSSIASQHFIVKVVKAYNFLSRNFYTLTITWWPSPSLYSWWFIILPLNSFINLRKTKGGLMERLGIKSCNSDGAVMYQDKYKHCCLMLNNYYTVRLTADVIQWACVIENVNSLG